MTSIRRQFGTAVEPTVLSTSEAGNSERLGLRLTHSIRAPISQHQNGSCKKYGLERCRSVIKRNDTIAILTTCPAPTWSRSNSSKYPEFLSSAILRSFGENLIDLFENHAAWSKQSTNHENRPAAIAQPSKQTCRRQTGLRSHNLLDTAFEKPGTAFAPHVIQTDSGHESVSSKGAYPDCIQPTVITHHLKI